MGSSGVSRCLTTLLRRRVTRSVTVEIARVVAQLCAAAGVVAGFWHIHRIAGVAVLAGGLVGIGSTPPATSAWSSRNPATPSPALLAGLPAWRRPCCCRYCCRWPSCGLSHVRRSPCSTSPNDICEKRSALIANTGAGSRHGGALTVQGWASCTDCVRAGYAA
jgi:hypothetical protein